MFKYIIMNVTIKCTCWIILKNLVTGVSHLEISFSCCFRGMRVPFCFLEALVSTMEAERPGNSGSGDFMDKEVGVGLYILQVTNAETCGFGTNFQLPQY
jgi:hypothetical protein